MNLTQRYSVAAGMRFPQAEIAGVGMHLLRPNDFQHMGGEIFRGREVPGGGYFDRGPEDVGDTAQRQLARESDGDFFARRILAGLGRGARLDLPMYAAGGDIAPGAAGIVGEAGPEAILAGAGGGATVVPLGGAARRRVLNQAQATATPHAAGNPGGFPAADVSPGAAAENAVGGASSIGAPGFYGAPPEDTSAAQRYGATAARLAGLLPPVEHGAHGWRRVLADAAGVLEGLRTRSPEKGIALHDYISDPGYGAQLAEWKNQRAQLQGAAAAEGRDAALEQEQDAQRLRQYDADRTAYDTRQYRDAEQQRQSAYDQAREQEAAQRLAAARGSSQASLAERVRHDRATEARQPRGAAQRGPTPDAELAAQARRAALQRDANTRAVTERVLGAADRNAAYAALRRALGAGAPLDASAVERAINERFGSSQAFPASGASSATQANPFAGHLQ